jgi:hypothetical protein
MLWFKMAFTSAVEMQAAGSSLTAIKLHGATTQSSTM